MNKLVIVVVVASLLTLAGRSLGSSLTSLQTAHVANLERSIAAASR